MAEPTKYLEKSWHKRSDEAQEPVTEEAGLETQDPALENIVASIQDAAEDTETTAYDM